MFDLAHQVKSIVGSLLRDGSDVTNREGIISLWMQSLCCALVRGNEASDGIIGSILNEATAAAWISTRGAVSGWACWSSLAKSALSETEV